MCRRRAAPARPQHAAGGERAGSGGVTLGFSVEALLPKARGGGALRLGLVRVTEEEWLDPEPDLAERRAHFAAHPESVIVQPEAEAAGREVAAMLGVSGGLGE